VERVDPVPVYKQDVVLIYKKCDKKTVLITETFHGRKLYKTVSNILLSR